MALNKIKQDIYMREETFEIPFSACLQLIKAFGRVCYMQNEKYFKPVLNISVRISDITKSN